jgi:hypothetical protein
MDNTCGICFEEMDMKGYQDERQSTQTCFKLDCNHAFHTKCIVECLQKTHKQCPSCNSEKTILEDLTLEGALQKLIEDVKKVKCVKESFRNCLAAKKDLTNTTNQLKKEIKEFAKQRKGEINYSEKRQHFSKCLAEARRIAIRESKKLGLAHRGMFSQKFIHRRDRQLDLAITGIKYPGRIWRLRYPYIGFSL